MKNKLPNEEDDDIENGFLYRLGILLYKVTTFIVFILLVSFIIGAFAVLIQELF